VAAGRITQPCQQQVDIPGPKFPLQARLNRVFVVSFGNAKANNRCLSKIIFVNSGLFHCHCEVSLSSECVKRLC
jgi:hypothetical protein